jgi:hypothetical protein
MRVYLFLIATVSLCLQACAGPVSPKTATMPFQNLNSYSTSDCSRKTEQLAFLENQRDNTPFWDKPKLATINYYIRFMQASCGEPAPKPSGCLVASEQFTTGHSQAIVCRDSHFTRPIINRWETEVDN